IARIRRKRIFVTVQADPRPSLQRDIAEHLSSENRTARMVLYRETEDLSEMRFQAFVDAHQELGAMVDALHRVPGVRHVGWEE
ncbi:MAG: hypothetical protein ACYC55_07015, partial [Candidatus Geothermincolia bacterium]